MSSNLPDHIRNYSGPTGLEKLSNEDVATPRLVLLQALSPQIEEDDSLKPGDFFHSGSEEGVGTTLNIIPLHYTKSYTLWRPRPAGGILARSRDGVNWDRVGRWPDIKLKSGRTVTWQIKDLSVKASGLAEWGSSDPSNLDSPPAAVLAYNIAVLLRDRLDLGPAILTMARSQIKVAKRILGRWRMKRAPLFALSTGLTSVKEQGPEGPFFNMKFGKIDFYENAEAYAHAHELFVMFQETGINVKDDDEADEHDDAEDDDGVPF